MTSPLVRFSDPQLRRGPGFLKEPTDAPLPLQLAALEDSNKIRQTRASANVRGVNAAIHLITIWHIQPVFDIRANGVTIPDYSNFHSRTNPIFDPAVTLANKFATMDIDPGTFCTPAYQHGALSNPMYYGDPSLTVHNIPHFGVIPVCAAAVNLGVYNQHHENLDAMYDPET